ncbi:PREDICTED: uncharacterized protein LOC107094154 [Cyprinodon variegatus]|uniref:uncharacterized protein LOC107094154 n=1 Tax=Cyprinodon variegatus TaxID=28743 RepID=UPI0007425E11|nr:PREDICTED: uncharacterized protein LOC107094154 [Cyprinodon variegatus]
MRKRQGTKKSPDVAQGNQTDSSSLSTFDQESFFKGLQQEGGNLLHSTALEDRSNVQEEGQLDKEPGLTGGAVPGRKRRAAAEGGEEEKEGRQKRTNAGGKGRRRPAVGGQLMEGASQSAAKKDSEPDGAQKKRRRPLSSDQDNDEDGDLTSGPKKTRGLPLGTKSEPDSASSREPRESDGEDGEPAAKGGSQLEVVLSAFVNFCQQYRETVESAAVRKSIDRFSKNVEVKLLEKISCLKEFKPLKRENTKVTGESQRWMEAGSQLLSLTYGAQFDPSFSQAKNTPGNGHLEGKTIQKCCCFCYLQSRAEKEASLLQKKKTELQQRLADLRRGRAFLQDIRGLTTQYLAYRRRKPTEKKTYGGSSLAALLLETKLTQRASRRRMRAAQQARK